VSKNPFDPGAVDMAWCPGCGNFAIRKLLMEALAEEGLVTSHFFNGLHGRALPPATAVKAANPGLTVIAESGDGDMYGEGGNHFIHTVRRNPGIVNIVHNNMVYGLTKGQASPTSQLGFRTPIQVKGVFLEPFNPLAVAISLGASFVARAFAGDGDQTKGLFRQALRHRGYALVDVFQPCVSFNKVNTYDWFREHTAGLPGEHDPRDRRIALERAMDEEKLYLGLFYRAPERPAFEKTTGLYEHDDRPLFKRPFQAARLRDLMESLKS
jgi:2-oxoglutarate ferredoxin oxidoreductase subunit beta